MLLAEERFRYAMKASICHIPHAAADFRLQTAAVTTTGQMHLAYSRLPLSLICACCWFPIASALPKFASDTNSDI